MTKWIGFPEFIKDPARLNKYYEDVSFFILIYWIDTYLLSLVRNPQYQTFTSRIGRMQAQWLEQTKKTRSNSH